MGLVEVRLPQMGMGMVDGLVTQWLQPVGARVVQGEPLVAVDNGKATVEIEAPVSGKMVQILAPAGATVPVGEVLAFLEPDPAEIQADRSR